MQQSNSWSPRRQRRANLRRVATFVTVGILSAAGVGTALTWSATANERPASLSEMIDTTQTPRIDVDSLYSAKAAEYTPADSSFALPVEPKQTINGRVSWYGPGFHGRRTASGERFDRNEMTAAHKTLPFGTLVRVSDPSSGKSVLVRINDRGPYCRGRVLDLAEGAAQRLGIRGHGTGSVQMDIYAPDALSSRNTLRAFDINGQLLELHGYSVMVESGTNFDEAIDLQHRLHDQGYEDVFLAQTRNGDDTVYRVYLGLFSSEISGESLAAELDDSLSSAEVVRFVNGKATRLDLAIGTVDTTGRM